MGVLFAYLVLFLPIVYLIDLQIILCGIAKHSQRTRLKFSVLRKSSILIGERGNFSEILSLTHLWFHKLSCNAVLSAIILPLTPAT